MEIKQHIGKNNKGDFSVKTTVDDWEPFYHGPFPSREKAEHEAGLIEHKIMRKLAEVVESIGKDKGHTIFGGLNDNGN